MKNATLILSLLLTAGSLVQAATPNQIDEFTTLTGRTYRKCRISQVHPDGISFFHSKGAAKVLFADLSDSWKKKLGYNAKRAEEFQKEASMKKFIEQERLAKAREQVVAQERQTTELRLRIMERAFELQARQQLLQQQQLAAYYGTQVPVTGPAPAIGWPGTYVGPVNSPYGLFNGSYGYFNGSYGLLNGPYGPLNNIYGPAFGGRPWNNCGSVTLASIGGGSGGYLSLSSNHCVWAGRGRLWNYPTVVNSPTLGSYVPGRFAPFGTTGPFNGVYLGGTRNLGASTLNSVAFGFLPTGPAPAMAAPAIGFRGSVSVPAP
jgi:hypothetical protein